MKRNLCRTDDGMTQTYIGTNGAYRSQAVFYKFMRTPEPVYLYRMPHTVGPVQQRFRLPVKF